MNLMNSRSGKESCWLPITQGLGAGDLQLRHKRPECEYVVVIENLSRSGLVISRIFILLVLFPIAWAGAITAKSVFVSLLFIVFITLCVSALSRTRRIGLAEDGRWINIRTRVFGIPAWSRKIELSPGCKAITSLTRDDNQKQVADVYLADDNAPFVFLVRFDQNSPGHSVLDAASEFTNALNKLLFSSSKDADGCI
jgi:hypothetical protein